MCKNIVGYQVTATIRLGNLTGEVLHVDLEGPPWSACEFLEIFRLVVTHIFIRGLLS